MRRYADPERCPDCLSTMPFGSLRCPSCGLMLQGPLASELFATLSHADDLLTTLRDTAGDAASVPAPVGAVRDASVAATAATATPVTAADADRAAGAPQPSEPARPRGGLAGASVPKILLALGALCLLIAALVFLAVTWSALGVAGRTLVLVGLTLVAGGLTAWTAHRDLRAATESLGVVGLGLLVFDLLGARSAGWFGEPGTPAFLVLLGMAVAAAGAAAALAVRRTPAGALVGAEVVATAGLATAGVGFVATDWIGWSAAVTVVVLAAAAVAFAAQAARLTVLATGAAMGTLSAWTVLASSGCYRALDHPSWSALWLDLEVWPLLAAAALAAALVAVRALPFAAVRLPALGVGALLAGAALVAPAVDEDASWRTLALAALVAGVAALALVVPQPWRRSLAVPGTPGLLGLAGITAGLAGDAVFRLLQSGSALWQGAAGDSLTARPDDARLLAGWLLPVLVLTVGLTLVAAARSFRWVDRAVAPLADLDVVVTVLAGTVALTLALYPVPVALVLATLLLVGAGWVARWWHEARALPLGLAAGWLGLAVQLSLHAEPLTLTAACVVLVAAAVVSLHTRRIEVSVGAGAVVSSALAGAAWTLGALTDTSPEWAALGTLLALVALTLAGPYLDRPLLTSRPASLARIGVELGALVAAGVVSLAGLAGVDPPDEPGWAAIYLTVSGAAVSAMALLRRDRKAAGWLGGLLLAAASWVRLADLGVDTPEAYTLPTALALLAVGLYHLRHHRTSTLVALSPGLALGLVPSLLWAYAEPVAVRSVILGAACLVLVVGGVRLRWSAPLVHGALVGGLLVLRHATPIAEAVPRWALIGAAGILLVAMGITWEARVRDARRVAGYVRGLR